MITQENTLGFEVEEKIMKEFLQGKRNSFTTDINDANCMDLLHNIESVLILKVDELPKKHHGCYYYNDGVFPYIIKKSLEHILLVCNDKQIVGKIVDTQFTPGVRFRFADTPGEPSVEDPNGDSCIWNVTFKLRPAR